MKNRYLKQYKRLVWLFAIFICSCSNYLEVKPDSKLAVPKTIGDLQALLDDAATMNLRIMPSSSEGSSDDYFLQDQHINSSTEDERSIYLWRAYNLNYINDWSFCYQAIYNTNLVLEVVETIERTTANAAAWDNVKGGALFYRAFFYAALVSQYGAVYDGSTASEKPGVVLRLQSDFNKVSERSNLQACYDQVLSDAIESIKYLPNLPSHVMRPSKCASYALLTRIFLHMGNYPKVIEYATNALAINNYLMNYNSDPYIINVTAAVPFRKFNQEIIFYAEQNTTKSLMNLTKARVDTVLYHSYHGDDIRKALFFVASPPYQRFKGNYTANAAWLFGGLATNEVYISRAEAYVMDNQLEKAKDDLNSLLVKRYKTGKYIPVVNLPKEVLLEKIRTERRKELLMQGLRWADIKRYNRDGANIVLKRIVNGTTYVLKPNDKYYAFPIPKDISLLTGIAQ